MKTTTATVGHVLCLTGAFVGMAFSAAAHPLDNWHERYTNASIYGSSAVAFGKGNFVAVGAQGTILTSQSGGEWAAQSSGTSRRLRGITFGSETFVAVGDAGTIISSQDGTNWTQHFCTGVSNAISGVQFGNGRFVAASRLLVAISEDGTNWSAQLVGATFDATSFAYGNGLFLLEGPKGTNVLSADGTNWFPRPSGSADSLYTLGFGGGIFVSIDIRNNSFTSVDAANWNQRGHVNLLRPSQIAFGGGHFVTVGGGPILFARDVDGWQVSSNGYLYVGRSVAFGNGTFVAVGDSGNTSRILQSDPLIKVETRGPGMLAISGPIGATCLIQLAGDLVSSNSWQSATNIILTASPHLWTDPTAPILSRRFYRAILVP